MAGEEMPKYRQVADDIRASIESGKYPFGTRLPSKAELMHQYGVALGTLDRAITNLRQQGYIETMQGVGMFASKPPPPEENLADQVARLTERIDAVEREVQDHARLLARMRQRLEKAGITLANADQRDEQAM